MWQEGVFQSAPLSLNLLIFMHLTHLLHSVWRCALSPSSQIQLQWPVSIPPALISPLYMPSIELAFLSVPMVPTQTKTLEPVILTVQVFFLSIIQLEGVWLSVLAIRGYLLIGLPILVCLFAPLPTSLITQPVLACRPAIKVWDISHMHLWGYVCCTAWIIPSLIMVFVLLLAPIQLILTFISIQQLRAVFLAVLIITSRTTISVSVLRLEDAPMVSMLINQPEHVFSFVIIQSILIETTQLWVA